MSQSDKRKFITNVIFYAVVLGLGYLLFKYLLVWMMPFLIGLLLAIVLQRPVNWVLRHSRLERRLVAPVVTLVMVALVVALIVFLFITAVGEAAKLAVSLSQWFGNNSNDMVGIMNRRFETVIEMLPQEWEGQIRIMVHNWLTIAQNQVGSLFTSLLSWIADLITILPSLLISFIVTLVATFFICSEFENIKAFFWRQVPAKYKALTGDTWNTFARTLRQMVCSYLLIMFVTFCELTVGLTLLRVDYSILLAALIALVDIMPVIGTGTVLIPWGLICLLIGNVWFGVGILILYVVITIVRNILEPKIVGTRIGLHPLVTLLMMYLGLHILGVPGIVIFPLLFILLKHAQEAGIIRLWKD